MNIALHGRPGKIRLGMVVPALVENGGVPAVAEFMCDAIDRSGAFELVIVSLSSSSRDDLGVAITRPASWRRGVQKATGMWRGRPYVQLGAALSELEFQRYRPRPLLREALADCQLIQVVCGSPAVACAVCGLGPPVAVHCSTRAVVERRSRQEKERGFVAAWRSGMTMFVDYLERKALRTADAIQVQSAWMLEYAQRLNAGRPALIRYVTTGVDATKFTPLATRDLRTDPYVLCVGRFNDERKNVTLLLDAFASMRNDLRASTRLLLAGSAGPKPPFWDRVKELGLDGRVSFASCPSPDELVHLYQFASAFALSSDEEGFGIVLLEAMACAVPVVATRCGGPDGIVRDGHDGYLADVGDVRGLSGRLERLLSDEALNIRLGNAGRRTVLDRFDSRVASKALLDTYDALFSGSRCGSFT